MGADEEEEEDKLSKKMLNPYLVDLFTHSYHLKSCKS